MNRDSLVYFSPIPWRGLVQRPQHMCRVLSRRWPILFVEPKTLWAPPPGDGDERLAFLTLPTFPVNARRALLRRAQPAQTLIDELRVNDIVVDFRSYEARTGDSPLEMTRREFQLLRVLASRPGVVITRSELLDQVWGANVYVEERTVDVHIRRLRKSLQTSTLDYSRLVQTVRGTGYRFSARGVAL